MGADPSIFQGYLTPPKSVIDYQNQYAQADQLRNQNALASLTLQQKGAEVQQGLASQNALQRIAGGWNAGTTMDQRVADLRNSGLPALMTQADALETQGLNRTKTEADANKANADAGKTTTETGVIRHQQHLQALSTVNTPDDAMNWIVSGVQSGALPKEGLAQALQKLQAASATPEGLAQWKAQTQQAGQTIQQQMEMTTPKPTEVRLGNVVKTIDMNPHSTTFGKEVVGPQAIGVSPDTAATNATSRANNAATIAAENTRAANTLGVEKVKADPYGTLGLNTNVPPAAAAGANKTGDEFLATLPPAVANQVKMLASGRMPITAMSSRSPQMMQLLAYASQYEPGTDATSYIQRAQTVKDFAPGGKDGQAITNANTALHHAGQVADAIDALDNSNILPGITNPVENWVGQKLAGQSTQGVYKQKVDALSSELRKLYAGGGGGSLSELNAWQSSFDANAGKDQQKAYLKSGMELLTGAIQAKQQAYERGMGSRGQFGTMLAPESMKVLQRLAPEYAATLSAGNAQPAPTDDIHARAAAILAGSQ